MPKDKDPTTHVKGDVSLEDISPADTHGASEDDAREEVAKGTARLGDLQALLYANHARALLVVLQGMDSAGKDGTVRHVMTATNPQGVAVTSFKVPTAEELSHDFLWRIHRHVPAKGMIGVFNRSHYEDVLSPRVHGQITPHRAKQRLKDIRHFEEMLAGEDVIIRKFFLHISKEEQEKRLEERIEERKKKWKISPSDFRERVFWPEYRKAYEDAIAATSTKAAPWYIVPADHKWYRNLVVTRVLLHTLAGLDMTWPLEPVPPGGPDAPA